MKVEQGVGAEFDPFAGPALERTAPTTEPQREIWTATQLGDDASIAFNESCSLSLEGPLDVRALQAALTDLVARHEAARTTISPDGTTLCVAAELPLPLEQLDLSELPAPDREARLEALLDARVSRPFALEVGPLLRFDLVRMGPEHHVLVLTAHHIVCDGFSTGVLLRDLGQLYGGRRRGQAPALAPAHPFSRYAAEQLARQATPEHAEDERYWVGRFSGARPPVLELPTDRPRPRAKTYASRREDARYPAELVAAVKKAGARAGASFFATLLTAVDVLLARLSGQDDLVVGIASAGQATAGYQDLVGHCVNTLPIRVSVDGEVPFTALLRGVRGQILDAQEHANYTFGSLIRQLALPRDPSRLPLVSVLFNLDPGLQPEALPFDGLRVGFRSNPRRAENFDLFLNAVDLGGELQLECQYNTDLFDGATIRRWLAALERILREIAVRPETPVARIPILPASDERQLAAWNETGRDWPRGQLLHELVEAQADRTPDAVAVRFGDGALSYRELDRRANQLAHHLRSLGAGPDVLVGISLERSLELLPALLAVHKAGAAYVPLDPAFPAERLAAMVADSGMPLLVTQRSLRAELPANQARVIELDGADAAEIAARPVERPPRAGRPEATAYVLYTSGSTGKPKGVQVPVSALVNFLWSVKSEPGLAPTDRLVAVTTLSFDIAGLELWLPVLVGATVVIASRELTLDGAQLVGLLQRSGATVMQATPATWRLLLAAGWTGGPGFKIICGGEALPRDLAEQLVVRGDVFNMYGPTETTIWSTCFRLSRPVGPVLIGRPLANQRVHVLDPLGQPVPIGVPGELYIAGDGVARGYLGRPDLTAERFVPDGVGGGPGARMYRTGDVVRLRPDGNLEFIGRNDGQVKIRGFRIELGEIEVALARHPAVAQAVAMAREDRAGDARLVGYVVVRKGQEFAEEALRRHLREILPEYMVPQHLVRLEVLPLTPNGKIDRKALPAPDASARADEGYVAPRTQAEQLLAGLWQQALGIGRVGIHDDFFALGGHSLLAAQVLARLAREHGISVPMRKMFEAPTLEAFAPLLEASKPAVQIPHLPGDGPAPVSFMQERIWNLQLLQPGRSDFNLPAAFRLRGRLDLALLQASLDAFVARHEAVRTTLRAEGDRVVQCVAPSLGLVLEPIDLSGLAAEPREAALMRELLAASMEPFDLERGPLVRARLYRLAAEEHVLFVLPHHAIWDGWSFDVLARDLAELYGAAVAGRPPQLPQLAVRYRDFSAWHRQWLQSEEVQEQANWWRAQLAGEVGSLDLPLDRRRTRTPGEGGETLWVDFPRAEMEALSALAQDTGATLFMVMLAAFQTVLHRWSGQDDVLVGTPLRGRSQPGLDDLVGTFINTLLLRTRFSGSPTFLELLARVRTTVTEAFAHEDVPFELLTMSRKPAFRALFSFQDVRTRPTLLGDLEISQVHVLPPVAGNDVSLWVMQRESGLTGGFNFSTALFDRTTAEAMLASLRTVVRAVIADPRAPVSRLDRGGPVAQQEGGPATAPEVLHAAFDRWLTSDPGGQALLGAGAPVDRRALDQQARDLLAAMWAAGVRAGSRVALHLDGPDASIAGLLALSRLGAVALPLDRDDPPALLKRLAAQAGVACYLGTSTEVADALGCGLIDPSATGGELPSAAAAGGPSTSDPALLAVLSESLGQEAPTCLELGQGALAAAAEGVRSACGLAPGSVLAVACAEPGRQALGIWLALRAGAAALPLSVEDAVEELGAAFEAARVTAAVADADVWRGLLADGFRGGPGFTAICAGEPIGEELAVRLRAVAGRAYILHGAAETGYWSAALPAEAWSGAGEHPCVGGPLPGVGLAVVDPDLGPVPLDVVGELAVTGATLARGYLAPAGEGCLVVRPGDGVRVVRTGERARQRRAGSFELLGRMDSVAMVRGRRLDLRAAERAMRSCPGVRDAAVALVGADAGAPKLVAWWSADAGGEADDIALRRWLRRALPRHAVPQELIELERIPRLNSGALDRAALPARLRGDRGRAVPPRTPEETLMAELWRAALGLDEVSTQDNFFDLGGHSLLCLQLVEQVAQRTGRRIPPTALLQDTLEVVSARLGGSAVRG